MTDEQIFELAEKHGDWDDFGRWMFSDSDNLLNFVAAIQEAEREACAKVCEENSLMFGDSALIGVCRTNASRIRSRGEE